MLCALKLWWIRFELPGGRALKQMEGEKEKRGKGMGNRERESAGREGKEINQVGVESTRWVGSTGSSGGCGQL